MIYIWYNPGNKTYESGTLTEYKVLKKLFVDNLILVYRFDSGKTKLADKIIHRLNSFREDPVPSAADKKHS